MRPRPEEEKAFSLGIASELRLQILPRCTPREASGAARQWLETIPVLCQRIFIQKSQPGLILTLSWLIKAKARKELGLLLLL